MWTIQILSTFYFLPGISTYFITAQVGVTLKCSLSPEAKQDRALSETGCWEVPQLLCDFRSDLRRKELKESAKMDPSWKQQLLFSAGWNE